MENFPQTYEPTGSQSILEQFVGLKNFMKTKLNSNEFIKSTPQELTEEEKAQVRENIGAGASIVNVIDNLTSQSNIDALSANQGRILNNKIDSTAEQLQTSVDENAGDIASLQGDVSQLNQTMQRTLKTPLSTPPETVVAGIDDNGDQINLSVGNGLNIVNGMLGSEHPVGSYYFCRTGANSPASIFGGTWTKVVEDVSMSFAGIYPVVTGEKHMDYLSYNNNAFNFSKSDGSYYDNSGWLATNQLGSLLRSPTTISSSGFGAIYPTNLWADTGYTLSSLSRIDIWLREA